MRLPKTIQVGPHRYAVSINKKKVMAYQGTVAGNSEVDAYIDHNAQVIYLKSDLGPDWLAERVLHETLHAHFAVIGWEGDGEEAIVTRMAPVLLDTLRRNPDLVAFLLGSA